MKVVTGEEDIMLITTGGVLIRMDVNDISTMGRNTQGVKLIRLDENDGEYVATVAKVEKEDDSDIDDQEESSEIDNHEESSVVENQEENSDSDNQKDDDEMTKE